MNAIRPRRPCWAHKPELKVAERQLVTLRSQMTQTRAQLAAAKAASNTAKLNLDDTLIRASIDGRIGDKTVQVGQFVQPGTRLMSVVPVQDVYLVANFKETQVRRMKVGQTRERQGRCHRRRGDRRRHRRVSRPAPAPSSRCCRPRTPPATSSRSCSGCRCASGSCRSKEIAPRLLPGLSVSVDIDTRTNAH